MVAVSVPSLSRKIIRMMTRQQLPAGAVIKAPDNGIFKIQTPLCGRAKGFYYIHFLGKCDLWYNFKENIFYGKSCFPK
jgi:hypothetical protein